MLPSIKVSVIVCTYNRAHAIPKCLDSIARALEVPKDLNAEIVVVDNASKDNTSEIVRKWSTTVKFPVNLQLETLQGLANARNCGIRAARGEILAFTDDDCTLDENYFVDLLRHFSRDTSPVLRGGRVNLGDPTDLPITIKENFQVQRWSREKRSAAFENIGNCIVGANMTMRRSLTEIIGLFDGRFSTKKVPAGEDADYAFRTYIAGLTIEYVPDMAINHYHGRKTWEEGNKLFKNYMIGVGALYAKHCSKDINLCRTFWWDTRNAIKELFSGKNTCAPFIKFSHKDKVFYNILGALRFIANLK